MSANLKQLVARLSGKNILVLGDVMLDEYITGRATRMSREAPVPVLEMESRRALAGGSANPAMNIIALGSRAVQVGVIGDDDAGRQLLQILESHDIDASGIVVCADRPTTLKTRVLAQMGLRFPQQVTRIDTVSRRDIDRETETQILEFIGGRIGAIDAILLSHYHGGLLTTSLVRQIRELSRRRQVPVTADLQGQFDQFAQLDVIKCNASDARRYLNRDLRSDADFGEAAQMLKQMLRASRAAIITRGNRGATLAFDGELHHCPAPRVSDVYDTVGAGDTAIAVQTLALTAGIDLRDAVMLSNFASGIVVRHLGNYAPTPAELERSIDESPL